MKISGIGFIYMITSPTKRLYVGSSIDVDRRFYYYKSCLAKTQIKLYRSFKKYGFENHVFEIIWAGPIEDMLKYETMIGWGFNVLEPENLNCLLPKLGDTYSNYADETKLKMSNSAKGKIVSDKTRIKIGLIWKGRKQSSEHINKRVNSFMGFKHNEESKIKMSKKAKGRIISKETKEKISKNSVMKKVILQYSLNNDFIKEWDSAATASKVLKINSNSICRCCRGILKTAGNFKWKHK